MKINKDKKNKKEHKINNKKGNREIKGLKEMELKLVK